MPFEESFRGFNSHTMYEGSHAVLSPSNYHWLYDSEEKLAQRLRNAQAAVRGTRLHEAAKVNIDLGIMVWDDPSNPVVQLHGRSYAAYVNDAIRMRLITEQMLFYSMNCFGTADAIGFEEYPKGLEYAGFLRIHDLKTGVTKASFDQLYVYAAIFCWEYNYLPFSIEGELVIYQGDNPIVCEIDRSHLAWVYDRIRVSDKTARKIRGGLV